MTVCPCPLHCSTLRVLPTARGHAWHCQLFLDNPRWPGSQGSCQHRHPSSALCFCSPGPAFHPTRAGGDQAALMTWPHCQKTTSYSWWKNNSSKGAFQRVRQCLEWDAVVRWVSGTQPVPCPGDGAHVSPVQGGGGSLILQMVCSGFLLISHS